MVKQMNANIDDEDLHLMTEEEEKEKFKNMPERIKKDIAVQIEKQRHRDMVAKKIGYPPEEEWMENA